jgi:hypothetical protein
MKQTDIQMIRPLGFLNLIIKSKNPRYYIIIPDGQDKIVFPSISQKNARKIMGKNMFGIEEAIKHFRIKPTYEQLEALSTVPFLETTLEQCRDTHVLAAVFPLSILELQKLSPYVIWMFNFFDKELDTLTEAFLMERRRVTWQLVHKTEISNSTYKSLREQQALLGKNDEIPSAQVIIYTIVGHYKNTNEQLFKEISIRTSSLSLNSNYVLISGLKSPLLNLSINTGASDNQPQSDLGITTARKPDQISSF